jgi:segregation and condensation protein B
MSNTPERQPDSLPEQAVSLDELAAAYAQSLGAAAEPASQPEEAPADQVAPETPPRDAAQGRAVDAVEPGDDELAEQPADGPPLPEGEDTDQNDPCPLCPATILEAMLFVGDECNEPLTAARVAGLMRGVSPGEIPSLVDQLNRRYASSGCPYRIVSEGPGYRIALDKRFDAIRNRFYGRVREARLSQAALDVLAIVAYRQPITAEQVSRLRDAPSGHVLAQLVRRQLLGIERPPGKRRPVTYRTTDRFLGLFGLDSLEDLPHTEDLEG